MRILYLSLSIADGRFEWAWFDWLGIIALIVGLAFFITVIAAIWRGESPLKILQIISKSLAVVFGAKRN